MRVNTVAIRKNIAMKGLTIAQASGRVGMERRHFNEIINRGTCSMASAGKISVGLGIPFETLDAEGRKVCAYE